MTVYEITNALQSPFLLLAIQLDLDTCAMLNDDIVAVADTPTISQPYLCNIKWKWLYAIKGSTNPTHVVTKPFKRYSIRPRSTPRDLSKPFTDVPASEPPGKQMWRRNRMWTYLTNRKKISIAKLVLKATEIWINPPIGEQLCSFSTKVTRTKLTHKKRIVRAAGAEYSSNPVALPITFLPKWGKKVADAENKFKAIRNVFSP